MHQREDFDRRNSPPILHTHPKQENCNGATTVTRCIFARRIFLRGRPHVWSHRVPSQGKLRKPNTRHINTTSARRDHPHHDTYHPGVRSTEHDISPHMRHAYFEWHAVSQAVTSHNKSICTLCTRANLARRFANRSMCA